MPTHLISNCCDLDNHLILGSVVFDDIAALLASIVGEVDPLARLQFGVHDGPESGSNKIRLAELLDHGAATQCLSGTDVYVGSATRFHDDRRICGGCGRGRGRGRRGSGWGLDGGLEIETDQVARIGINRCLAGHHKSGRRRRRERSAVRGRRFHVGYGAGVPEAIRTLGAHLGADDGALGQTAAGGHFCTFGYTTFRGGYFSFQRFKTR